MAEALGWYGVTVILGSYALANFGILAFQGTIYQFLNLTGAVALGYESYTKRDVQPVVLNAIWALVAALVLFRMFWVG